MYQVDGRLVAPLATSLWPLASLFTQLQLRLQQWLLQRLHAPLPPSPPAVPFASASACCILNAFSFSFSFYFIALVLTSPNCQRLPQLVLCLVSSPPLFPSLFLSLSLSFSLLISLCRWLFAVWLVLCLLIFICLLVFHSVKCFLDCFARALAPTATRAHPFNFIFLFGIHLLQLRKGERDREGNESERGLTIFISSVSYYLQLSRVIRHCWQLQSASC